MKIFSMFAPAVVLSLLLALLLGTARDEFPEPRRGGGTHFSKQDSRDDFPGRRQGGGSHGRHQDYDDAITMNHA